MAAFELANGRRWDRDVVKSEHAAKFFSLIPFFMEASFTRKNFVLAMDFYPKAGLLKMNVLRLSRVQTLYVPVNQVIPITKYDYWGASWIMWFKQNTCLDLDMIYAH